MKTKEEAMAKISTQPMSRSLRLYQRLAIAFVILSVVMLLGVLYLSVSQAVITIIPAAQTVFGNYPVELTESPQTQGQLQGYIRSEVVTKSKMFTLPSEGATAVEEQAGGFVTLINETNADQPLVATTRLLSEEGVLFRLVDGVTVPANGQLEAEVYADQEGASGNIGPTQFTIPGLTASLQDVIYAVSVDSMTGGLQYIRTLEASDLEDAERQLRTEIQEEAELVLREGLSEDLQAAYDVRVIERVSDVEPGTETGTFTVALTVQMSGVFYAEEDVYAFAEAALYNQLQEGQELISLNPDSIALSIDDIQLDEGVVKANIYMDGISAITTAADILDKDALAGRQAEEVTASLQSSERIEEVQIELTPFWLKRIPSVQDHIRIHIKSAK